MEESLAVYLPKFEYIYHDLAKMREEDLKTLNNEFLLASILTLKYAFDREWLEQNAIRILLLSQHSSKGLQKSLILYLFSRTEVKEVTIEALPDKLKKDVMNTLDIYFEKGIEKGKILGIEEGKEIGIEEGKIEVVANIINNTDWSDDRIADVAGVSEELVRKIRNSSDY